MKATERGVAWNAQRGALIGRRVKLRLGCGVGRNGGGAKTGESESDDESADEIVLHDVYCSF